MQSPVWLQRAAPPHLAGRSAMAPTEPTRAPKPPEPADRLTAAQRREFRKAWLIELSFDFGARRKLWLA